MCEILENKKYLRELINKQIKNIKLSRRLLYKDLDRITKYIKSSIFDEKCCLWQGYVTNSNKSNKGTYTNFFFRNKKVALHRLLYENFVGELGDAYYLKFSCPDENRGKCCNIHHMIKYKYIISEKEEISDIIKEVDENIEIKITFD